MPKKGSFADTKGYSSGGGGGAGGSSPGDSSTKEDGYSSLEIAFEDSFYHYYNDSFKDYSDVYEEESQFNPVVILQCHEVECVELSNFEDDVCVMVYSRETIEQAPKIFIFNLDDAEREIIHKTLPREAGHTTGHVAKSRSANVLWNMDGDYQAALVFLKTTICTKLAAAEHLFFDYAEMRI